MMGNEGVTEEVHAEILLEIPEKYITVILEALKPETDFSSSERSVTEVTRGIKSLLIVTNANDTSALRASLNSYLRWLQSILDILKVME
jgi:KEOPS complex subunit Pcc1